MTLYFCIAGVVLLVIYFIRSRFDRAWNIHRAVVRAAWGQEHGLVMDDPVDRNAGVFSNYRDYVPLTFYNDLASIWPLRGASPFNGAPFNFMRGTWVGMDFRVFDYSYVISYRGSSTTHYYGVVAVELPVEIPPFEFRPQSWRDALTTMLGDRDIKVGFEEVDKAFHISCPNEMFMRSFVDSLTEQHLREMTNWRIICVGHTLVILRKALCSDTEYEAMLNAAITLQRRVKQITS